MAYGTVKVDNVTFTYNAVDATTTFSGFYASTTNNLTLSGTASAATFTGTTANFTNVNAQNISVTTALSGLSITGGTAGFTTVTGTTVTGTTASFTSGVFTSLSGTTHTITSGVFASGTAALPSISFVSDPNTGVFSPGADQLAVATNGTQKLIVLSNGNVGIGVSDPGQVLVIGGGTNGRARIKVTSGASNFGKFEFSTDSSSTASTSQVAEITANIVGTGPLTSSLGFATNAGNSLNTAMTIDSSQRVGIGTTAPSAKLTITETSNANSIVIRNADANGSILQFGINTGIPAAYIQSAKDGSGTAQPLAFYGASSEWGRFDTSGRFLVGTSSSTSNIRLGQKIASVSTGGSDFGGLSLTTYGGTTPVVRPVLDFQRSRGTTDGSLTAVATNDFIGVIVFRGSDGSNFVDGAFISAEIDGAVSTADLPTRLVFSTTEDGASSPTERMRIQSNGRVLIGGTVDVGAYDLQVKATGVWGAGAYVNGSDRSLKEEIAPLASSLDLVKQLNPVSFRYKKEFSKDNSTQPGFIAQELRETLADQVYLDGIVQEGPEFLSVAYQGLIPVLAKALQEAVAKIETLEAKVASLESA